MKAVYALSLLLVSNPLLSQNKTAAATSPHTEMRQRYEALVCGIAFIQTERGSGTGFFINPNGDIVTAAHVISNKTFKVVEGRVDFDVVVDKNVSVTPHDLGKIVIASDSIQVDKRESSTDLAFFHTNAHPKCFIPLGNVQAAKTGDHLISIGFPGIDQGNPILYDGFLSGRFPHPPIAAVAVVNGTPIYPKYEILKVQMPITPGASGSPVIDDSGAAIGVISESPIIWTQELQNITQAARGSGMQLMGFDVLQAVGQFALVVREFESPGSGYAVPISGLSSMRGLAPTAANHVR